MSYHFKEMYEAVKALGSKRAAAEYFNIPRETFRTNYDRAETEFNNRPKTHVVIPDSHSDPSVPNDRFKWAGQFCRDMNADVIVDIGDRADMASLCFYDRGTKGFENRRYKRDLEHVHEANQLFEDGLGDHKAVKYLTLGNHEDRINKVFAAHPEYEGLISTDDLKYKEHGWNVSKFKTPITVDGVSYCHYFASGVMGKPIGGENHAASLIKKGFMSATCGHSHLTDSANRTRFDGTRMRGLVVGCYFPQKPDFAGHQVNNMWDRGIVVKRNVQDGDYDYEWVSYEEMEKRYGS